MATPTTLLMFYNCCGRGLGEIEAVVKCREIKWLNVINGLKFTFITILLLSDITICIKI